jgi:DNA-binding CsgD family transcriptional regulator
MVYVGVDVDTTALRLIDLLYAGLEDDAALDAFVENLAVALNATAAALVLDLPPTRTFGLDQAFLRKFDDYYHAINVHEDGARKFRPTPGIPLSSEATCPDRDIVSSEYFNDFLRPQKLFHVFGTILNFSERMSNLVVYPPRQSTSSACAKGLPLIASLVPHLRRVNRMAAQLGLARVGTSICDRIGGGGVVVVNVTGKVLFMNAIAERMIALADGLSCRGGVLRATQPQENTKLKLAIRSVCAIEKPSADQSGEIELSFAISRRLVSRSYAIVVEPFFRRTPGSLAGAAILHVSDPEEAPQVPEKILNSLYGLTSAESRLSNLLLKGSDLNEACALLRITRNTGRAHLRSIFDKLGVRTQSQLVAVLARSLAVVQSRSFGPESPRSA